MPEAACVHIGAITTVRHEKQHVCEECVKIGSEWVHLRTCQQCGVTLCCDSSPNRHTTKHAHATKHPVVASAEPGERWLIVIRTRRSRSIDPLRVSATSNEQ